MKEYIITIERTIQWQIEIKAEGYTEALAKAERAITGYKRSMDKRDPSPNKLLAEPDYDETKIQSILVDDAWIK